MSIQRAFAVRHEGAYSYYPQAQNQLAAGDVGSWAGAVQTTDATPTNLVAYSPNKKQVVTVTAKISAVKSDGSAGASFLLYASARRDSSGTLTLLGAATIQADADGGFAPTAELNVSGTDVVAILTGVGATTINWSAIIEVA